MNRKIVLSLTLIGLFAANLAFAMPAFEVEAPQSSVDACVAEVAHNADYSDASSVLHKVASKPRSVSGFTVSIRTIVYGDDTDNVVREYASHCAINRLEQIRSFKIRQRELD